MHFGYPDTVGGVNAPTVGLTPGKKCIKVAVSCRDDLYVCVCVRFSISEVAEKTDKKPPV